MDKQTHEQQMLDFAAAEGIFRERLSTLGNLVKVLGATCIQANVLRFIFEEGGCHREVELDLPRIGGLPWIQASENTVRMATVFWERAGIIEIERDRRMGRFQAPNTARLLWSFVLQRLFGEGRSVASSLAPSAGQIESSGDRSDQRFFSASNSCSLKSASSFEPTASNSCSLKSASSFEPTASNSCSLKTAFSRSLIRMQARVRMIRLLSSVVSVDDDVDSNERSATCAEVLALAEEARRPIYPVHWPRDPQVKQLFVEAAILAMMLFSREWILAATRAAKAKSGVSWRYWVGCLRNGLVEIEGLEPFADRQAGASYYAQLTNAIAPIAREIIAQDGEAELVPVATRAQPEERAKPGLARELRAQIARQREAPP